MPKGNKNMRNVPNLRFPEFLEKWEVKFIGELSDEFKSGKFIKSEDITKTGQYPVFGGNGLRGFTNEYNHNGEFVLIGRQGALCGNVRFVRGKCYMTEHAIVVSANKHNHTVFLLYLLDKMKLNQYSDQSAQPGLAVNKLLKLRSVVPSLAEQKKIASLLSYIDLRIQTQNKIIAQLESLIKVLNEALFYQKIRFPNFKDEWNTYKVSDFLEFFSTNSLSWEQLEYGTGSLYNLHYGLIHLGNLSQLNSTKYIFPNIKVDFAPNNYSLCQDGDIAFADASEDTNDVAKCVEFCNCGSKKIVCGLHTIHGRDKLNITITGFKGYAFSSKLFHHQVRRLAQGTKVFSISPKTFNYIHISIPSKQEQRKITNILSLIEQKVVCEKQLLEKYEAQKQYLLKNMFV